MMKDIREVLFEQYSDEVESGPPTEMDKAFREALEALDDQTCNILVGAVTDVINEQMRMAFMAGFNTGANTCRMAYAVAV